MSHRNPFAQQRLEQLSFRFPEARSWTAELQVLQQLSYRAAIVGPRGSGKSTLLRALHRKLSARCCCARSITAGGLSTGWQTADGLTANGLLKKCSCDSGGEHEPDAISEPLAAVLTSDSPRGPATLLLDIPPLRSCDHDFGLTDRQRRQWLRTRLAGVTSHTVLLVDGLERLPWLQQLRLLRWARRATRCAGLVVTLHQPSAWTRLPIWVSTQPTLELLQTLLQELGQTGTVPRGLAEDLFKKHRGNLREALRELYDREVTSPCQPR